jgi:hypothetical protein
MARSPSSLGLFHFLFAQARIYSQRNRRRSNQPRRASRQADCNLPARVSFCGEWDGRLSAFARSAWPESGSPKSRKSKLLELKLRGADSWKPARSESWMGWTGFAFGLGS